MKLRAMFLCLLAAIVPALGTPSGQVSVTSPPYCSEISGPTRIAISAPGLTSATVRCWKEDRDSTIGTIKLGADGAGSLVFSADDYPRGPINVRISGTNGRVSDNCYLQLYNKGGVSWREGIPATPAPEAAGLPLIFADDFNHPLSISSTDPHATYFDHKPGGGDFSALTFTGFHDPHNPFAQVDTYLRIRADEKTRSSGLISSLKADDSGVKVRLPCYFECRFLAQSARGTWPAFWIMTDYMTDRLKGHDVPVDELDIIEAYGGEGPKDPTRTSDTSDAAYRITSHFWNQGLAGDFQRGVANAVPMRKLGSGASWWETFHTYGCKITAQDTIYYCDDIEVGRHPTGAISKRYPFFFLINFAVGGNGWPVDLSRYGGIADMYVDYVRVYGQAGAAPAASAATP